MSKEKRPLTVRSALKFIWGVLPVAVLGIVIVLLSHIIGQKTDRLEAAKTGVQALYGVRTAISRMDQVVEILKSSADDGAAVRELKKRLHLTDDQAKAVVHLPLNALTRVQQEKRDRQIAYLERRIAEKTLIPEVETPEVNVVVLDLSPGPIRDRMNLPGIVEPWVKYNIVSEVRGKVVAKHIEKGEKVNAGDVIVDIDPEDYRIALQAAKASHDTASAAKGRLEKLYKEQLASRSQLDDITAQVEQFKAQMDSAALNLSRCRIRSPISGRINDLHIEKGQYVNLSDPVAEILRLDPVKVVVGIPESDVSAVTAVNEFKVAIDALGGKTLAAEKYFLSRAGDPQARLYNLELRLANPSGEILPDMFARVEIVKTEKPDAVAVPLYAILPIGGDAVVYVVDEGGSVSSRKVKTGIQEGWRMEITEGLVPGDRVIVVGHRDVGDGQKVRVIRTLSDMEELAR